MSYVTLCLPFNACGNTAKLLLSTAWLFKIATNRMLSLAKQIPVLPATDIGWKSTFRKAIYELIPNRRYTDGVIVLIRGVYESCCQLGIDFRSVELSDWLMFQQVEKEYPASNITLKRGYELRVTVIDYDGDSQRVVVKPTVPKSYRLLLDKILEERQRYTGRVVVKDYGVRKRVLWVRGEVQLIIPYDFYHKHLARYRVNNGRLFGGVDINTDRINLAIVDGGGRLRDVKTFWFGDAARKGCSRHRARSLIGAAVHAMLRYAYHHSVKTLFLESPEVLGYMRWVWIRSGERKGRNYNWRVSTFRCSQIAQMIAMKAPLYSIGARYVDPEGTTHSEEHDEIAKRYGLDKHTASAYLIALKGLKQI